MPSTPGHNPFIRPPLGIVVAMTRAGIIGRQGGMPWDLPADRQLFRRLTEGNTVIMGRLTFESLPAPLPRRCNIVLSRTRRQAQGVTVCRSLLEGIAHGWRLGRPIFVIGGVDLYRKALPLADTLHISWVEGDYPGDRRFPPFDISDWAAVEETPYPGFRYIVYRRTATREGHPPCRGQNQKGQPPCGDSP